MNLAHPSTASSRCGDTITIAIELAVAAAAPTAASGMSRRSEGRSGRAAALRLGRLRSAPGLMTFRPPARLLVQHAELLVAARRTSRAVRRVGRERCDDAHVARQVVDRRCVRGRCPASSAAPRALARIGCSTWRISRCSHVGHDPAPQLRLRSAADEVQPRERPADELLHRAEQPAAVVRDSFEHGTHELGRGSSPAKGCSNPARNV